jgi:ribosomal-protein-alanine N-acetyltransferase
MVVNLDILIRRGSPGEFVFMAELAVRAWEIPAKGAPLSDQRRVELEANFLGYLHENADGVLVAEANGKILGWGALVPGSNYIADLWIDPPCHGQGIGGRILDALMAQILLDGFDTATIGTHADNLPAIGLYEKMGFRIEWQGEEASASMGRVVEKVRMRATL